MAAFPGQVEFVATVGAGRKRHTQFDQPADRRRCLFDGKTHGVRVVEAGTGIQCVGNMGLKGICCPGDGGNAALGVEGAAFFQCALGQHGNLYMPGQMQCQGEPGCATANNQDIKTVVSYHMLTSRCIFCGSI